VSDWSLEQEGGVQGVSDWPLEQEGGVQGVRDGSGTMQW
jgi:hypothetical protein